MKELKELDGVHYYCNGEGMLYRTVEIRNQPVSFRGLLKIIDIIRKEFPGFENSVVLEVAQESHSSGSAFGYTLSSYSGKTWFTLRLSELAKLEIQREMRNGRPMYPGYDYCKREIMSRETELSRPFRWKVALHETTCLERTPGALPPGNNP